MIYPKNSNNYLNFCKYIFKENKKKMLILYLRCSFFLVDLLCYLPGRLCAAMGATRALGKLSLTTMFVPLRVN